MPYALITCCKAGTPCELYELLRSDDFQSIAMYFVIKFSFSKVTSLVIELMCDKHTPCPIGGADISNVAEFHRFSMQNEQIDLLRTSTTGAVDRLDY